jgi:major inositol transporter-like SP family MFS transporter
MLKVPESPRWLVSKGRSQEALTVLEKMREKKRAKEEVLEIETAFKQEENMKKATLKDLSVPWIRRLIFIGIGIGVVQQITGVNSIMYYGTEILKDSGFGTEAALVGNIANGVISVLATFVGIWLLGKVGRRPMLITGLIGTTSALLLIGILSLTLEGSPALPYVVLTLTVTFLAFQQGAVSPVTWLMLSEIFPLRMRGMGMGITVFCLWIANFLVGLTFPILLAAIGLSTTFFVFVILGIVAITFVKKALPETKGLTLEQIEENFRNYKQAPAIADKEVISK